MGFASSTSDTGSTGVIDTETIGTIEQKENALIIYQFLLEFAKVANNAGSAARFACDTSISAVQNQPMMSVNHKLIRNKFN